MTGMMAHRDIAQKRIDAEFARDIGGFFYDPLGFVLYVFPWGVKGSPLEAWDGPDEWQVKVLSDIGRGLVTLDTAVKVAISAGHGVGKSALMSWIIMWWIATRTQVRIVATAGTKTQLATKLWPELGLWVQRSMISHWYEWQATSLRFKLDDRGSRRLPNSKNPLQRADAIPWSERNPDAFAGTHGTDLVAGTNAAAPLYIFDEASSIADIIWETSEGAMSDEGAMWLAFGNPVRSSGRFYECFHKFKESWRCYHVDARTARMPNKAQIEEWARDYGEQSDFFKVRVLGQFPNVGSMQLIPTDLVERAMARAVTTEKSSTRVLGVDVARFGDDASVICKRTNNEVVADSDDGKTMKEHRSLDTMTFANVVAGEIDTYDPDTTFVDGVGLGAGVVDRLRQLSYRVIDVNGGASPDNKELYTNKRTEMFVLLRDWLKGDVSLPNDPVLKEELIGLEYGFVSEKKMALETKKDFKQRLGRSPDKADAIALTFGGRVRPKRHKEPARDYSKQTRDWRLM